MHILCSRTSVIFSNLRVTNCNCVTLYSQQPKTTTTTSIVATTTTTTTTTQKVRAPYLCSTFLNWVITTQIKINEEDRQVGDLKLPKQAKKRVHFNSRLWQQYSLFVPSVFQLLAPLGTKNPHKK